MYIMSVAFGLCQKATMAVDSSVAACIMKLAPLYTTVRVNTLTTSMESGKKMMIELLNNQYKSKGYPDLQPSVEIHPIISDLLVIKAVGPNRVEPMETEIYVDEACASAVLRGADIFACGVLGSNKKFRSGDGVSVYADLAGKCLWGHNRPYTYPKQFLGNGIVLKGREELYAVERQSLRGVGVSITEPIYVHPKFDQLINSWAFAQNLPSVACCHILNPQPGDIVLDLCAASGGKSTHLATLMKDEGKVICIDVATKRLPLISQYASTFSLKSIEVYRADGTNLVNRNAPAGGKFATPPFPVESFDKILVDAPCSGLGARPFLRRLREGQIASFPQLQKKLLKTAIQLLKKGGILVYSTCTLNELENEDNIEWVLKTFPFMKLVTQEPYVMTDGSDVKQPLNLTQKFDPRRFCRLHNGRTDCLKSALTDMLPWNPYAAVDLSPESDTIGFFIAKFIKGCDEG